MIGVDRFEAMDRLRELAQLIREAEDAGEDTGRLTPGQYLDLQVAVARAEPEAEMETGSRSHGRQPRTLHSEEARRAAVLVWLREPELGAAEVADRLGLDPVATEAYLSRRGANPAERDMVRLHFEGDYPDLIASKLGVPRQTVRDTIKRAGEVPHLSPVAANAPAVHQAVIQAYRDGRSYRQIMRELGLTRAQLRHHLVTAAEAGALPEYGGRK